MIVHIKKQGCGTYATKASNWDASGFFNEACQRPRNRLHSSINTIARVRIDFGLSGIKLGIPGSLARRFGRRSFLCDVARRSQRSPVVVLPSKYLMASWSAVEVPSTPKT